MLYACGVHHVSLPVYILFTYIPAPLLPTCAHVKMRESCVTVLEKQLISVLWITPCSNKMIVLCSYMLVQGLT